MNDTPPEEGVRLDLVGTALSALGLGLIVFGILRSGTWGFVQPKPDAPEWLGLSPVIWLILAGGAVLVGCSSRGRTAGSQRGEGALIDPAMLRNLQLRERGHRRSSSMFLVQAGLFFVVPLFLSVALGLSAVETGVRLLPLSLSLLLFAVGSPEAAARTRRRGGSSASGSSRCSPGLVLLVALLDVGAGAGDRDLAAAARRAGIGAMASQLGGVTVSAVPDEQSGEVGGLQNTGTQLGASIGTALAGAVLISALTASFFTGIAEQPGRPRPRRRAGADGARRRRPVHLRRRPRGRARRTRTCPPARPTRSWRERAEPHRRAARRRVASWRCSRLSRCRSPEASRQCNPAPSPHPAHRRHSPLPFAWLSW